MSDVWLVDTTYRDVVQGNELEISEREKMTFIRNLAAAQIDEVEMAIPVGSHHEWRLIREVRHENPNLLITCWCRAIEEEIKTASRSAAESIHINFPVANRMLEKRGLTRTSLLDRIQELMEKSFRYFTYVSVSLAGASETDPVFLYRCIQKAADCGASKVRLEDKGDWGTEASFAEYLTKVKKNTSAHLEYYFRGEDKQMALDRSLSAIECGYSALVCGQGFPLSELFRAYQLATVAV